MKFPRVVRLDSSDVQVFRQAAAPGEWAVAGTFAYVDLDPTALAAKDKLAFHSAWLGTESFGQASLVEVAEITEADFFAVVEHLARHFVERYGAPDLAGALPVAREEADLAAGLCSHKIHTLMAIERDWSEDGIHERVRVIKPGRATDHARIWEIQPDDEGA
ncbi:MAG: DUF6505 family protein [Pseudomonadota bacterium]